MGKGGRIACILTPWLLTIASFVCLVLIEIAGWKKGILGDYYFMKANFTDLSVSGANSVDNTTTLTAALQQAQKNNQLEDLYEIHLWNYCTGTENGTMTYCSSRKGLFTFNLIDVWHLNATAPTGASKSSSSNPITSEENNMKNKTETFEKNLLGDAGEKAYHAYKTVSKVMFVLYAISFWSTFATIVLAIFAIFSRWGSFCTWIFSFASSVITGAAALFSTIMYAVLVGALRKLLDPYGVKLDLGTHALVVIWLGVVFSWAGTLFWLLSICCCSGRSNPHHRSNKGGLWNAEPKGQGYGNYGRGMRVEKTGSGYERVASPFVGHDGDQLPLHDYPQQTGYAPQTGAYEPFRHS